MKLNVTIEIDGTEVKDVKVNVIDEPEENLKHDYSIYARFFDEACPIWSKEPEYNLMFLKQAEALATERLKTQGYLFLNEVYDMLGLERSKAGQLVGWIYDTDNPIGDNYVSFGLYNTGNEDFINKRKNSVLLDFNVDGNIFERMD